ncbi:MAG TPA: C45 family peptidase [Kofleriaceae bacterium]|nr:C45 family peptidase [Kofleriaceae bacterium]
MMHLQFRAVREDVPGPKWQAQFQRTWPAYSAWFLSEGEGARPGYLTCQKQLERHMPELVPIWTRLAELGGGSDQVARMLSLYRPPPYMAGCSQALWTRGGPALVRNYDYHPGRCEGLFLMSAWHGTRVIAVSDSLWGVLDGMNEHGLAVALAFGGRRIVGDGFGIPLVLRYVLEFCRTTEEAVATLRRIPVHMAYTISVIDRAGSAATVFVNPDREAELVDALVATNHQHRVEWPEHAELTHSLPRAELLEQCIAAADETLERFVARFLEEPLFGDRYDLAFGTLYTAVYRPDLGSVEFRWRNRSWHQSFDRFVEGVSLVRYS